MKKVNRKRIIILIIILLAVIFEVVAFRNSRATKLYDITAEVVDFDAKLDSEELVLTAIENGSSGTYITLPEYIGTKKIDSYVVKQEQLNTGNEEKENTIENTEINSDEEIESENSENINNSVLNLKEENSIINNEEINNDTVNNEIINNIQAKNELVNNAVNNENNITNSEINNVDETRAEKNEINNVENAENTENLEEIEEQEDVESEQLIRPGQMLYLTKLDEEKKSIKLVVKYQNTTVKDEDLYYQKIESDIDNDGDGNNDTIIRIDGLMPLDAQVLATPKTEETIEGPLKDVISNTTSLSNAYDIKIIYNEKEYEPTDFDINVNVSILGLGTINKKQKYKVIHIDDTNKIEEIKDVKTEEGTVSFTAKSFSTYAILLEDGQTNTYSADLSFTSVWDGSTASNYRIGTGTEADPYLISNGEELAYLAKQVNEGTTYEGVNFRLIANINLNGNEWTPIGKEDENPFKGKFEGSGYTIANAKITLPETLPTIVEKYGLFGVLEGTSENHAYVRNLQIDDISIEINATGQTSSSGSAKGYNIGIAVGRILQDAEIKNVIVNNSTISNNETITIRNSNTQIFIGGIVGYATGFTEEYNWWTGWETIEGDPGEGERYSIINCYSNVNIDVNLKSYNTNNSSVLNSAIGGILGGIRYQPVWPENCLYIGSINSSSTFVGPIFGWLRDGAASGTSNYPTIWNGYNADSNLSISSYFASYSVNGMTFLTSVTSGNSTQRYSSSSLMGTVQGVNKGIYTSDLNSMLNLFNNYVTNNPLDNGVTWKLDEDSGVFYFEPMFSVEIMKNSPEYMIILNDLDNTNNYTFKWYIDGVLDSSKTTDVETITSNWTDEHTIDVLVNNGKRSTIVSFDLPLLELHFNFDINSSNNTATAVFAGSGLGDSNFNVNDYEIKWYKMDSSWNESEEIEGANTLNLSEIEEVNDYKIIATNTRYEYMSTKGSFTYGTRQVIYVDSNNGSNNNDGLTPETAVRTMNTGFDKLLVGGTEKNNYIVVMGDYFNSTNSTINNELHNATKSAFKSGKCATITGMYMGINYESQLYLYGEDILIGNNMKFEYLHFRGSTGTNSSGLCMMYSQGHDLTMGKGIYMDYYQNDSITTHALYNANSPNFHILGGFLNYNLLEIPDANNGCTITIQSGTYARVIAGSRNTQSNGKSHNITGTEEKKFKVKVIVDIQESTTPSKYLKDINSIAMGQTDGSIYANTELEVYNGIIGRIIGGNIGNTRTISGYSPNSFWGSTKLSIYDGIINELYGASLGRSKSDVYYYGNIELNIYGGTILQSIYGAGAGGVTGYSENSTDIYKETGRNFNTLVKINIIDGIIQGNIYGAGYGYSQYLNNTQIADDGGTLYGDSDINISGGDIKGNVFGGSKGYGYTEKTSLAKMYGNSYITISGNPTITGAIYGAGDGTSAYPDTAKLIGTTNITIENNLINNTYGGGNASTVEGTTNVHVKTGNQTADIYGGGNIGPIDGTTNVYIYDGSNPANVYGGGKSADATTTNIYINGGKTTSVYGGSNTTGIVNSSNVSMSAGTTTVIYGGNNNGGTVNNSLVTVTGGTVNDIYGGNNNGGTSENNKVVINGGTIKNDIYGGGNEANSGIVEVDLNSAENTLNSVYGGGKSANATLTTINCNGINVTNVYGGSNTSGDVTNSNLNIKDGFIENLYGGNNLGGSNETSTIKINGGTTTNVFGGGNQVAIITSNIDMNKGDVTNIYGGGNNAGATTTNVNIYGGNLENSYGGSNQSGNVEETNVNLRQNTASVDKSGVKMNVTYTVKEAAEWEKTSNPGYISVVDISVTYTNSTDIDINKWNSYISSDGSKMYHNYASASNIADDGNGKYTINQENRWSPGTTNKIPANGSYSVDFTVLSSKSASDFSTTYKFSGNGTDGDTYVDTNDGLRIFGGNNAGGSVTLSKVTTENGNALEIYGGNNKSGETITSNVNITGGNVKTVYGGNNLGGTTESSNVNTAGGTVTDIYGGGNKAITNVTNVTINSEIEGSVYGGGNEAGVNTNANVKIENAKIAQNVYGGGNEGAVFKDTFVEIKNSKILDNVFAGGNGTTALVYGNANLIIEGTNTIITNSVFGGGNQAATGTEDENNSTSIVNIVGGNIGKNVYGGANTSVVYGYTKVNIGFDAVNNSDLELGDILIGGTIFGGGEANASGSEVYDFSYISVTRGIDMNINGNGHTKCVFKGSIFGSGNASSTSGYSYINIKNYGAVYNPQSNISIQRANVVTMDNSAMTLSGTTDRTNEYSNVYFTLSRIDELKLKNNSILYLNYGANLLKKLTSCVDENGTEVKAAVTIDEESGNVTKNVDNRIYMAEGKNLNIATNEQVTAYGEVSGMTFFGLYTNTMSPSTSTGIYNREYNSGDEIVNAGTFSANSYVLAQHKENHDTSIDGFYSNFEEEENQGFIKTEYIKTTPEDDVYYIWLVGIEIDVTTFEVSLTGSKYATLGTYELGLTGFAVANTKFVLSGFSAGLANGISLINPGNIENISINPDTANKVFGLSMKSGNNGWSTNSSTYFLTENGGTYTGTSEYNSDNSSYTPALNFCFYHSGNISLAQDLGSVKIRFQALVPIDDLNYSVSFIDVNVTLLTALYQNDFYEAAVTPGEEFSLFTTTETNITDSSVFSTYYSLYIPEFSESRYYDQYKEYNRVLVSRDSNNIPYPYTENTKITMIDMITNKYYYYVVTKEDETSEKYVYNLSDFVAMGSDSSRYDEESNCDNYYNQSQDLIYENYIFHIDFNENIITENQINNSLLMELRDNENQTLIGVLGIQRDTAVYSVYKDKDALIDVEATINNPILYRGNKATLKINTEFKQNITNSKTIFDTNYFDDKMGIKISIYDNNGNRLNSDSLLGVSFTLGGITYYPRIDGTVRIKIADKISNVLSRITIDTSENTTISTGDYKIQIDSFGSPDGIYYGIEPSKTVEVPITIIDSNYGLKIYSDDKSKVVNMETGKNDYDSNSLWISREYTSALSKPNITVALYRRKYDTIYSQEYEIVDLADYVSSELVAAANAKEYFVSNTLAEGSVVKDNYLLKENLKSGTYKIVYKLYDDKSYIGEAFEYLIIK